jgi:hypothetical protein
MTDEPSLGLRAIKYLPVIPLLFLISYYAIRVDPYPSEIRVTQRSCSDPANNSQLTFRQQTYCVTDTEAQEWARMWRNEYLLMAAFALSSGVSAFARHAKRPLS